MSSRHIRYGIDLGTTNSAISRIHRGRVEILKNDYQNDTTASAVHFAKRALRIGQRARNDWFREQFANAGAPRPKRRLTAFLEFKRTMGTDHRYEPTSRLDSSILSEELSAETLKELLRFARLRADDDPQAVVVTIPAAFQVPQQQATQKAAELAGVRQCHLLQEPVAAAMAFGLEARPGTSAKWLVFDFGGGTFDAALVVSEDGQITVRDTEGDNRLGGKDLDQTLVDELFLPEIEDQIPPGFSRDDRDLVRRGLRKYTERVLIELSTREAAFVETDLGEIRLGSGDEIDLDFELSRSDVRPVVTPLFERAIGKAEALLDRHGLSGSDLDEVILVGGPTHSPILRDLLSERLRSPNTSVDPMTAVAQGAALYASTVALNDKIVMDSLQDAGANVLALDVDHETTSIDETEFVTVRFRNPEDHRRFGAVEIELRREGWASTWEQLHSRGVLFEAPLESGKPNTFTISARTSRGRSLRTDPSELTIIQGVKLTGSPLNNNLGVAVWTRDRTRRVFKLLEGAERPRTLPVVGVADGLRTTGAVRPGTNDRLRLPIWESQSREDGQRLVGCDREILVLELRGMDVPETIPEASPFRLTIETSDSATRPVKATLYFESIDEEFDLPTPSANYMAAPSEWVDDEADTAGRELSQLRDSGRFDGAELIAIEDDLDDSAAEFRDAVARSDTDGWSQALDRFKEALRRLYKLVDGDEWPRLEAELDEAWKQLYPEEQIGGPSDAKLRAFEDELQEVKARPDVGDRLRLGRGLRDRLHQLHFERHRGEICRGFILWTHRFFNRIEWQDVRRARQELDAARQALQTGEAEQQIVEQAMRIRSLVQRWPTGDLAGFNPRDLPQL